jgi:NB-ARC domain
MDIFIDRETPLQYISDIFATLSDKKRLSRPPIIDFYGVGGIGKTVLLHQVRQRCQDAQLRCVWVDLNKGVHEFSREIVHQIQQEGRSLTFEINDNNALYQSISATRVLLKRGPVVLLFDSVDTNNNEQVGWIEMLLRDLSDDDNLFVVLASKRVLSFQNDRLTTRKLAPFPLLPFDRQSCEEYLNSIGNQSEPEIRHLIITWTRGYPLALQVMAQAVNSGLDPRKQEDQKKIISIITTQVLHQNILARVDSAARNRYQTILSLLSIPRHFNLSIMEDLIEEFSPDLRLENSLAYFGLPMEISKITEILNWSAAVAGFSVDVTVRALCLLRLRIEQPEMYYDAHRFLARTYRQLSINAGTDQVRCLDEYLYHSSIETSIQGQSPVSIVEDIVANFPESVTALATEIELDGELKELLGTHFSDVHSLLEKGQA